MSLFPGKECSLAELGHSADSSGFLLSDVRDAGRNGEVALGMRSLISQVSVQDILAGIPTGYPHGLLWKLPGVFGKPGVLC